jgi:hypothetical protein
VPDQHAGFFEEALLVAGKSNGRTKRSSEREPADLRSNEFNVIGGWLPPLSSLDNGTRMSLEASMVGYHAAVTLRTGRGRQRSLACAQALCLDNTLRPFQFAERIGVLVRDRRFLGSRRRELSYMHSCVR